MGTETLGYYLDIHTGETAEGQITPEQARDFLLCDGAHEDEYGFWFAGGQGTIAFTRRKQKYLEDREASTRLLQAAGLPLPPEEEIPTDRELVSFRYSWSTNLNTLRECCLHIWGFCVRYGLRLYDGQVERYITPDNIDMVMSEARAVISGFSTIFSPAAESPELAAH